MKQEKSHRCLVFFVILFAGAGLHFLYDAAPSPVTALFAPVDESLFQHAKLLFWPLLAGTFWLNRWDGEAKGSHFLGILIGVALMLGAGYGYHVAYGGNAMWVDLAIYGGTMLVAFWIVPAVFRGKVCIGMKWEAAAYGVLVLGFLLLLFTFRPPDNILFQELDAMGRFSLLPR